MYRSFMERYLTQHTDLFVGLFYVNVRLFCVNIGLFIKSEEIYMEHYVTRSLCRAFLRKYTALLCTNRAFY